MSIAASPRLRSACFIGARVIFTMRYGVMRRGWLIGLMLAIAALPAAAQAQVGRRNFIEPLVVEDANPSNSLDLVPYWVKLSHGTLLSTAGSLEKQFSRNFSLELASGWD